MGDSTKQDGSGASSAVADLGSEQEKGQSQKRGKRVSEAAANSGSRSQKSGGSGASLLDMYKPGQGYYTRMGTAIGAGILAVGLGKFIYDNLSFDQSWAPGLYLKIGIPAIVVAGLGVLIWWLVGVHRRSADFLIATDGEMKKVNWSTRKEIIASTKVVIVVTLLMAVILFLIDLGFMHFFRFIGVLRGGGEGM